MRRLRWRRVEPRKPISQQPDVYSCAVSYFDAAILEAFAEDFLYRTLVLFLNDARSGGKYPKSALSHPAVVGLAC